MAQQCFLYFVENSDAAVTSFKDAQLYLVDGTCLVGDSILVDPLISSAGFTSVATISGAARNQDLRKSFGIVSLYICV